HFDGIDDRDAAAALTGTEIWVDSSQFEPAAIGEYYWHELIGLAVHDGHGADLGRVEDLMETGRHDVLRVRGLNGGLFLVPFVERHVLSVDRTAGVVTVDWQPDWI
ncbi:MAG: ribosome maturation factor RimM, partial [Myxococcota bacterium]